MCVTSSGRCESRAEYLERWATSFDPEVIVYWDYRDEHIAVFGAFTLVRAVNKYTIIRDGEEASGMAAYTDTYLHQDGNWKCVFAQITTVAPANYPSDQTIVRRYIKGELQD